MRAPRRPGGRSADLQDRVAALAGRRLDHHLVARVVADERAADRRRRRDPARLGIRFVRADDRVGDGLPVVLEVTTDPSPTVEPAAGRIDDDRRPQPRLDRLDPALEERLLLPGGVVVGVLLEVAVLLGRPDPGDDLAAADVRQLVELGPQPRGAVGGERLGGDDRRCGRRPGRGGCRGSADAARGVGVARGVRVVAARALGAGGSPFAPSASPSGTWTTNVGLAGAAASGSARSEPVSPVALRSPVGRRRLAHGRTTSRSGSAARSVGGHGRSERREQRVLVLLRGVGQRPPDPDPVERSQRLEPVRARMRPPVAELGPGDRGDAPADRGIGGADVQDRLATAARTRRAGAARARDDGRWPSRSRPSTRSIHLPTRVSSIGAVALGSGISMTKTPGPCAGTGRPHTAGPSAIRPTERRRAAASGGRDIVRWYM